MSYDDSFPCKVIVSLRSNGLGYGAKSYNFDYQYYTLMNILDEFTKILVYKDKQSFLHLGGINHRSIQGISEKYSFPKGSDISELNLSRVQIIISLFLNFKKYSSDDDMRTIFEILFYLNYLNEIISEDIPIKRDLKFPYYLFKEIVDSLNSLKKIKDEPKDKDNRISEVLLYIRNQLSEISNSSIL